MVENKLLQFNSDLTRIIFLVRVFFIIFVRIQISFVIHNLFLDLKRLINLSRFLFI